MIITKEALRMLAALNSSCRTFLEKKKENTRYIFTQARDGRDMSFGEFLKNFPDSTMTYKSLGGFAQRIGAEKIDEDLVVRFFGGQEHVSFTLEQISDWERLKKQSLSQNFKDGLLFAHLLVPLEITNKNPIISGKYLAAGHKMRARGLVAHPLIFKDFQKEIKIGATYLVHYATIIGWADNKTEAWLRSEHVKSPEFLLAMKHLGEVDYRKFWSLKQWTENLLKEIGF